MIRLYVNNRGWVMGGSPEKGLKFTRFKAGARPFDEIADCKALLETRIYIEEKLQCHYDVVKS